MVNHFERNDSPYPGGNQDGGQSVLETWNHPKSNWRVGCLVLVIILALGASFAGSIASAAVSPANIISLTGPSGIGFLSISTSHPGIATIHVSWPLRATDGLLEAFANGHRLSTFIWNGKQTTSEANYTIDVSQLDPVDGKVSIELRSLLRDHNETVCSTRLENAVVVVSLIKDTSSAFAETLTVGNYLRGKYSHLIVRIPEPVSADLLGSAANLISGVIAFAQQDITIEIQPVTSTPAAGHTATPSPSSQSGLPPALGPTTASPTPTSSSFTVVPTAVPTPQFSQPPLRTAKPAATPVPSSPSSSTRTVELALQSPTGMSLIGVGNSSVLIIGGDNAGMARQIAGLRSTLISGVQSTNANVSNFAKLPRLISPLSTLGDLALTNLSAQGTGSFRIPFGIDQSALGGPVQAMTVNIDGATDLPPRDTSVRVDLTAGTRMVASVRPNGAGKWSIRKSLSSLDLGRFIDLAIEVSYDGVTGNCLENATPLRASINTESSLRVTVGTTVTTYGFTRLPQAFLPVAEVAIDDQNVTRARQALQLVAGMQRLTRIPLYWSGISPEIALVTTESLVAAVGYASPLAQQGLPVFLDAAGVLRSIVDPMATISAPTTPLLSVGSPTVGPTARLILASGPLPSSSGDMLLAALGSDPAAWSRLAGDAAAVTPDGIIRTVTLTTKQRTKPNIHLADFIQMWWVWFLLGVGSTIVSAGAIRFTVGRSKRSKRSKFIYHAPDSDS